MSRDEFSIFKPGKEVLLENGDKIELPKVSWRKEIKILEIASALFQELELSKVNFDQMAVGDMVTLFSGLFTKAPNKFTDIVVLLTNQNTDFVNDHMTSQDILGLVVPFFVKFFKNASSVLDMGAAGKEAVDSAIPGLKKK
jgi:hypothetical protein